MRLLLWLVLALLVVLALRKKLFAGGADSATGQGPQQDRPDIGRPGQGGEREAETMVCCAHCQLHVPASEAVYRDRQAYCCEEHARLAAD